MTVKNEKSKDIGIDHLTEDEKRILLDWAKNVKSIQSNKKLSIKEKLKALKSLNNSEAFKNIAKYVSLKTKHYWENANWSERLGIICGGGTFAFFGFGGSGIAAMGGAVGLPLFLVTAAGGTLIGTIIDKLDNNDSKHR